MQHKHNPPTRKGSPIAWLPDDIVAGKIAATEIKGNPLVIIWEAVMNDPGRCKLDWVIADPTRNQLSNASNMLDVTWEAPDSTITPLDGYLDGYFQEIYLDAASAPIFNKVVKQVSSDSLEEYRRQEGTPSANMSMPPKLRCSTLSTTSSTKR